MKFQILLIFVLFKIFGFADIFPSRRIYWNPVKFLVFFGSFEFQIFFSYINKNKNNNKKNKQTNKQKQTNFGFVGCFFVFCFFVFVFVLCFVLFLSRKALCILSYDEKQGKNIWENVIVLLEAGCVILGLFPIKAKTKTKTKQNKKQNKAKSD